MSRYELRWTVHASDPEDGNAAQFWGYGATHYEALADLRANLEKASAEADSRAVAVHSIANRVRGEIAVLE